MHVYNPKGRSLQTVQNKIKKLKKIYLGSKKLQKRVSLEVFLSSIKVKQPNINKRAV